MLNKRLVLGLGLALAASAAHAEDWKYEFTPYLWGSGLDGTLGARGVTMNVDASFSDILSNMNAAFMGMITAQKGPWTLGFELDYVGLEEGSSKTFSGKHGLASVNSQLQIDTTLWISQATVGYRVLNEGTKLDVLGALRYTALDNDAQLTTRIEPGVLFPGGTRTASSSDGWLDVVAGVRVLQPLSESVSLLGYADVGGGGSNLTYQLMAGVNWQYAPNWSAKLGYRYLSWDYKNDNVVWDVSLSGPYLGVGMGF